MENLLSVLFNWGIWLFDAIGVNFILKKIAKISSGEKKGDSTSETNRLVSPKLPTF